MSFLIEIAGYGLIVPALLSLLVAWMWRAYLPLRTPASRWPAATGFLAGILTSLVLLPWFPWWPSSTWHWLPYVAVPVVVLAASGASVSPWERGGMVLVAAAIVAVPVIPDFAETRIEWIVATAVLAGLGGWNAEFVVGRWPDRWSLAVYVITGLALGGLLALSGSTKFGQTAGVLVAGLLGAAIATAPARQAVCIGAIQLLAVLATVAHLYSFTEIPAWCYFAVVLAPAGQWIAAAPFVPCGSWQETVSRIGGSAICLVISLTVAAVKTL